MEQKFNYSKNFKDFLNKNNIKNCQEIKDTYEFCREHKYPYSQCNYFYDMSFICLQLKYNETNKK